MQIKIRKSFSRDAKKCTQPVKEAIAKVIEEITNTQSLAELNNVKSMKGSKAARDAYRMRVDDYRIVFISKIMSPEPAYTENKKTVTHQN